LTKKRCEPERGATAVFSDSDAVARYADGPRRQVPGFEAMQRMAEILLAETAPENARIFILGAGGGLELAAFARSRPGWSFDGVDPSPEMLKLARQMLGPDLARVQLHEGYVEDGPAGPFDGAACLLTMHFVPKADRVDTLRGIRTRLKPGAAFVCAHHSIPGDAAERNLWLTRYAAFAASSGIPADAAERGRAAIRDRLAILSPEDDEAALVAAGFTGIRVFYTGFTFRGWVAYAP